MAGTKAMVLDAAGNSEVAKLANGWTTSRWIKFEDVSDSQQPSLMLNNHMDGNFYEGFGGLGGGFQFGFTSDLTVVNFMMISIGVLFVSTVSVSLYAVPKILYHRGILAQPRRIDPNTQGTITMASEGHLGASVVGDDMATEEMAELKSELSEMRNTCRELREDKMELQVKLRHYSADDPGVASSTATAERGPAPLQKSLLTPPSTAASSSGATSNIHETQP